MIEKKRIMIVEDEGITAMRLQAIISDMGHAVSSVEVKAEDAVTSAAADKPDLVLMDIVLAGEMDGVEAAGRIHSDLGIPVVYITAYADEQLMQRIKKTEPFGYIIKPFAERELRAAVEITLYKHGMETRLRESEELFRHYFELANIGFALTSIDKSWIRVNKYLCEMLGYTEHELFRKTWVEMTHPDDLNRDTACFNRVLSGEINGYEMDKRFYRKNGEIVHIHLTVSCMKNPDGSVKRFIATLEDITGRRKAEEERERVISELREALAQVKTLSGLLPICASCKKIRDDKGYWQQLADYFSLHSEIEFTHGICPECARKLYPDYFKEESS